MFAITSSSLKSALMALVAIAAMGIQQAQASSVTYSFDRITSNANVDIGSQLKMTVEEVATEDSRQGVLFTFRNDIGVPSSITDIYFDDVEDHRLFLNPIAIYDQSSGVSFHDNPDITKTAVKITGTGRTRVRTTYTKTIDETRQNLPGGNDIDFEANDSASANPAHSPNGVNAANEWISFLGLWAGSASFNNLLEALEDRSDDGFRVGLHVQSINGGPSDSYVNGPPAVPLPAAAWLFGSALIGFVALSNRRKV